jgi:hypothetical protein
VGHPDVESHETVGAFLHAELVTAAAHSKPVSGQRPEGLAWFTARQRRSSVRTRRHVEAALRRLHVPLHVDWATPDKLFVVDFLVVRLSRLRPRFQQLPRVISCFVHRRVQGSAQPCCGWHRVPPAARLARSTCSSLQGGCRVGGRAHTPSLVPPALVVPPAATSQLH